MKTNHLSAPMTALNSSLVTSLVDCIRSTNSTSCLSDPIVVDQPQRFYRVVLTNCVPWLWRKAGSSVFRPRSDLSGSKALITYQVNREWTPMHA